MQESISSCHCSRLQRAAEIHICKGSCFERNFQYLCEWTVIFSLQTTHDLAIIFSGVPPDQQVAVHWVRTVQTCGKACVAKPSLSGVPGDVWDPRGPTSHPILQQGQWHCPSSCWAGRSCWELASLRRWKNVKSSIQPTLYRWQLIPTEAEWRGSVTDTPDHRLYFGSWWWRCNKPQSLHGAGGWESWLMHRGMKMPQKTYFERWSQSPKMQDNQSTEHDIRAKWKTGILSMLLTNSQLLHSIHITIIISQIWALPQLQLNCSTHDSPLVQGCLSRFEIPYLREPSLPKAERSPQ